MARPAPAQWLGNRGPPGKSDRVIVGRGAAQDERAQSSAGLRSSLTILANFARSALNRSSNSLGVLPTASLPVMRRRSSTSGADNAVLAACCRVATISRGVLAGTNQPCQLDDSK